MIYLTLVWMWLIVMGFYTLAMSRHSDRMEESRSNFLRLYEMFERAKRDYDSEGRADEWDRRDDVR